MDVPSLSGTDTVVVRIGTSDYDPRLFVRLPIEPITNARTNPSLPLPPAHFLINSGATHDIISEKFALKTGLLKLARKSRRATTGFNGTTSHSTYEIELHLDHQPEPSTFIITNLKDTYKCILGMPWVRTHGQHINWANQRFHPLKGLAAAEAVPPYPPKPPTGNQGKARILSEGVCALRTIAPPQCELAPPPLISCLTDGKLDPSSNFYRQHPNRLALWATRVGRYLKPRRGFRRFRPTPHWKAWSP
jgi:hypothetical protein